MSYTEKYTFCSKKKDDVDLFWNYLTQWYDMSDEKNVTEILQQCQCKALYTGNGRIVSVNSKGVSKNGYTFSMEVESDKPEPVIWQKLFQSTGFDLKVNFIIASSDGDYLRYAPDVEMIKYIVLSYNYDMELYPSYFVSLKGMLDFIEYCLGLKKYSLETYEDACRICSTLDPNEDDFLIVDKFRDIVNLETLE